MPNEADPAELNVPNFEVQWWELNFEFKNANFWVPWMLIDILIVTFSRGPTSSLRITEHNSILLNHKLLKCQNRCTKCGHPIEPLGNYFLAYLLVYFYPVVQECFIAKTELVKKKSTIMFLY